MEELEVGQLWITKSGRLIKLTEIDDKVVTYIEFIGAKTVLDLRTIEPSTPTGPFGDTMPKEALAPEFGWRCLNKPEHDTVFIEKKGSR